MQKKPFLSSAGALAVASIVFLLAGTRLSFAQTTNIITLTNSDALGLSSFNTAGNWDSGLAPISANPDVNAYFTTNLLRTPAGGNNYAFAGDTLEIDSGGAMGLKGYGLITVSNLVLNGGKVSNSGTGGSPDTGVLAGTITVQANSSLDGGPTAGLTALNLLAPIAGAGGITIQANGTVIFSTNNSYTGNTTVSTNSSLKINAAHAIPNGPAHGFLTLSGGTPSGAVLDLNGFDLTANDITSGGGVVPAQIINSAVGVTNTVTVDTEFATGKTFKGYIKDNNGTGGGLALTVIGSTFWTASTNLSYSGDTTINGGRLIMGAGGNVLPWGVGKGNVVVNSPGILDLAGRSPQMNGVFGNGIIDNYNTGTGRSTLNCGSNDVSSTFTGVIQNQFYTSVGGNYLQISKFGAGTLTLTGTNTYNGPVTINSGVLRITYQNGDGVTGGGLGLPTQTSPPGKTISITSSTGDAGLHLLGTNGDITLDPSLSLQTAGAAGAIVNEAGNNTINGPMSLRTGGGTTIRVDAGTLTLASNITLVPNVTSRTLTLSGTGNGSVGGIVSDGSPATNILSLTKSGGGTWTLDNANTYSDVTTIAGGTLKLGVSGSVANSSTINVQSGAVFDVALVGGWTLDPSGGKALKGNGAVLGDTTINGKVNPGDALLGLPIGALTFSSHLTLAGTAIMELNRTNTPANADSLTANNLTFGGALTVTNLGDPLQAGDSFTLFHGALNGAFAATNLPALSGSLIWDTSLLASQGIIKVVSPLPPPPAILPVTVTGTNLNIQFASASGFTYYLESATNLAAPVWLPVRTNSGGGTISLAIPIDPAQPKQFFRVSSPNP